MSDLHLLLDTSIQLSKNLYESNKHILNQTNDDTLKYNHNYATLLTSYSLSNERLRNIITQLEHIRMLLDA